jgi:2-polyprenyl-6-methoxyphenol hydroxylase-like FAD-dependent oxidoreductase
MNHYGKTLGILQHGSLFGYSNLRVPRRYVREELLKEAERKGIRVCYEKKFSRVEEIEGECGVKVYFEDGEVTDAEMVVGADGLRSSVRQYVNAECKPMYSGTTMLFGKVSKTVLDKELSSEDQRLPNPSMLFGKEGSFTVWPRNLAAEEVGYFANIELLDRSKQEWREFEEDKEGLRDLLKERFCQGGWPEQVQIMCHEAPADELKIWPSVTYLFGWKNEDGHANFEQCQYGSVLTIVEINLW